MLLKRSYRRFGSWLAIMAMALNALWPLLAHVKPGQSDASIIEVCTSDGMKWIAADASGQQPAQSRLAPHCEFCSLGADRAPLPTSPAIAPIEVSIAVAVIAPGRPVRIASQFSFFPALPRAPPPLS